MKTVAEWNLPPMRFEEVGAPSAYLGSLRPALFVGALVANPGGVEERTAYTIGGQIDFNFTVAHRLPMTFSAGFASGFEHGNKRNDEFLLTLKIM